MCSESDYRPRDGGCVSSVDESSMSGNGDLG